MVDASHLSRRRVLQGGIALGALGAVGLPAAYAAPAAAPRLPARGNIVIRNAYVMTMEPATPDIKDGDVHVKDGVIVAVGQKLSAPGAAAINGAGMIVLPGLVETHWHMWNTLLRSMSGEKAEFGYFRTTAALGQKYEPTDMYLGTRLAAAEAINNGITFVHDWCHNIRSPAYVEQDLRALRESGLRARFSYGAAQGMPNNQGIVLADLERLARDWPNYSNDGLITLGLAWRGMGGNNPATAIPEEIYKAEIEAARKLGLPISVHASGSRPAIGQVATIAKAGLLAKDMQIIHGVVLTPGGNCGDQGGRRFGEPVTYQRAAHRLRLAANCEPAGGRHSGRVVGRHGGAHGQRRHVRHHEVHPEHRERQERKRVQAHCPPRA